MPADKREPIDVMHSRGKKIYFRAMQSGTIKDNKSKLKTYKKSVSGRLLCLNTIQFEYKYVKTSKKNIIKSN